MFWTVLATTVLVLLVTRTLLRRWKYDLHKVPSPPGWPLLGNSLDFLYGKDGQGMQDFSKWVGCGLKSLNYPKLMRFDILGEPWLLVTDEKFIKTVMMSYRAPFPRITGDGESVLPMMGNNLHVKPIATHAGVTPYVKAIRRVYTKAVQSNNLRAAMPKTYDVMRKVIGIIESAREKGPIDIQKLFLGMTLDVICAIAFDMNMGGLDGSRDTLDLILAGGHITRDIYRGSLKSVYCKVFPRSKAGQHQSSVLNKLRNEWKLITDEILARDDPVNGEEPIWYGMKHLTDPETKKRVDYDLLLAEVAGAVIAGMDTTGHQLSWIFALLATRPDVVNKILDELEHQGLYGSTRRDLQFEDLSNLDYLNAVVKEGMRVAHVSSSNFRRRVPTDMNILGYRIPKGTLIVQPGNRAFNIDTDWSDPESFKPERWLGDDDDICRSHNLQFSTGPRDCPGQKLAMLEMRVAIAVILQKYEISLVGSYADLAHNAVDGIVIGAKDGIWSNFVPRKTSP